MGGFANGGFGGDLCTRPLFWMPDPSFRMAGAGFRIELLATGLLTLLERLNDLLPDQLRSAATGFHRLPPGKVKRQTS